MNHYIQYNPYTFIWSSIIMNIYLYHLNLTGGSKKFTGTHNFYNKIYQKPNSP